MNIPPESTDDIRRRVAAAHRLTRRARIEAMETELSNLKAIVALMHSQVVALKAEVKHDDATTIKIRALPERPNIREFLDPL